MSALFVLDAWAVLAFLQGEEPAASRVRNLLEEAQGQEAALFLSIINLGEVVYRVGKVRGEAEASEILAQIRRLPITIVSASNDAVWAAVRYKMHHAISYADAFALATAESLGATLATGDPELIQLADEVPIEKLERHQ
ncbi:MAG: type II toxin-antitoxin system VapC family toxin [Anaerolineae bacterium]|nr:type II toxin-antitoxin system VapC family toxin [Anaerolineae bacterium]